jgi:hypothetical protein
MKTPIKAMLVGVGACALAAPALAYTISGTIPAGARSVVIKLHRPNPAGLREAHTYRPAEECRRRLCARFLYRPGGESVRAAH